MKPYSFLFFILFVLFSFSSQAAVLTTLNGKNIPFENLKGKWVIINYWASWCNSCLAEIEEFNEFYAANKERIALFAVNYDGLSTHAQQKISRKYHLLYPSLASDPAQELELGSISGVPVTFLFDPQGKLRQKVYGPQTAKSLLELTKK